MGGGREARGGERYMQRLPGDPSIGRWLLFAIGFRLAPENLEWVRHELTDYGWRGRTIRRLLVVMIPVCVGLFFLPSPLWLRNAVPAFPLIASVGTIAINAHDQRAPRAKQPDPEIPDDPHL